MASGTVEYRDWCNVDEVISKSDGTVAIRIGGDTYRTNYLAVTPGAYVNDVVRSLGLRIALDIWEMSSAYFRKLSEDTRYPTWFVFQEPQATSLFYGFPEVDWSFPGYVRVAPDIPDRIIGDPKDRSPEPSAKSLQLTSRWVANHMSGLDSTPQFTSTCLIALASGTSNKELLLDYAPSNIANNHRIVAYTAGWAAKFIPILGEMICRMFEGDVQQFEFGRFSIARSNFAIDWESSD